ncbi:19959_t:CDS:1, partial [Racocetra fulgida]
MRTPHEIRNYFRINTLKTRLICNKCEANYPIDTNLTNLKNHFEKCHNKEYHLAIEREKIKRSNRFHAVTFINEEEISIENNNNFQQKQIENQQDE